MEEQKQFETSQPDESTELTAQQDTSAPEEAAPEEQKPDPHTQTHSAIMLLAGGYLLYLAYKLIQSLLSGSVQGAGPLIGIIAAVVAFIGFGGYLVIRNLRKLLKK